MAREALHWYGTEAKAIAHNLPSKNHDALTASMTVLSLDGGLRGWDASQRIDAALSGKDGGQ